MRLTDHTSSASSIDANEKVLLLYLGTRDHWQFSWKQAQRLPLEETHRPEPCPKCLRRFTSTHSTETPPTNGFRSRKPPGLQVLVPEDSGPPDIEVVQGDLPQESSDRPQEVDST